MHLIKLVLISFVFFFLLITGISLFIPSHIRISKAININSKREAIMARLKDPVQWKSWYPGGDTLQLVMENGQTRGIYTGPAKKLLISSISDSSVVATGSGPMSNNITMGWNVYQENASPPVVQWYIDFKLHWYPWEKFSSLLFEKRYGVFMEKGLNDLKSAIESPKP